MKKLLLLLMLAVMPLLSNSQPLFGYSPSEIRQKLPNADWAYSKWGTDNDMMTMSYVDGNIFVVYFFNEKDKAIFTTICPTTQGALQAAIELYNDKYVIVDSYTWKFYNDGSIFLCRLKQNDNGKYYFLWSMQE